MEASLRGGGATEAWDRLTLDLAQAIPVEADQSFDRAFDGKSQRPSTLEAVHVLLTAALLPKEADKLEELLRLLPGPWRYLAHLGGWLSGHQAMIKDQS